MVEANLLSSNEMSPALKTKVEEKVISKTTMLINTFVSCNRNQGRDE
jgi:hypothetical protein